MQRLLEPLGSVGLFDAFLVLPVMQQVRRIQIQRVTLAPRWKPVQAPVPNPMKGLLVDTRSAETLEKPSERRLAPNTLDPEHRRQGRIAPQKRYLHQLPGALQQSSHKTQRQIGPLDPPTTSWSRWQPFLEQLMQTMPL